MTAPGWAGLGMEMTLAGLGMALGRGLLGSGGGPLRTGCGDRASAG